MSLAHVNRFMRLAHASLLLPFFPNAKEITESIGAWVAIRDHLSDWKLHDRGVTVVVVGDGHSPRTGAMIACNSAWAVHSVDPAMAPKSWRIDRLTAYRAKIEDVAISGERVLVVAVHSHATLRAALASITASHVAVVSMPCCVPQELDTPPDVEYRDEAVASPERRVLIWKNARKNSGGGVVS